MAVAAGTVCAAAVLGFAMPQPATAATPRLPGLERVLGPSFDAAIGTGNGAAAWLTRQPTADGDTTVRPHTPFELWTLRDDQPVKVTVLDSADGYGASAVEVGTDTTGVPMALVQSGAPNGTDEGAQVFRLVRLDTGQVRVLPSHRRGLRVGGMALDHGRLLYTLGVARPGKRNTSALWRAPLTGMRPGTATRIRTSRRGEQWTEVAADQNRVALRTDRTVVAYGRDGILDEIAFGTPLGRWHRTGGVIEQEGPFTDTEIAGFTHGGGNVVTVQDDDGIVARAVAASIRTGRTTRTVALGRDEDVELGLAHLLPDGRLLAEGADAAGDPQIGLSGVAFPPAG